jgi:hypothetical protein
MMVRPMQSKPPIFVVAVILLVPFVYVFSIIPDVCAAPRDPNWGVSGDCFTEDSGDMMCCWDEPDLNNPGETITWCQTCESNGENCGPVYLKPATPSTGIPPSGSGGGVLQDPSTGSHPKASEGGFLGDLKNKLTSSQSNISSSNASK